MIHNRRLQWLETSLQGMLQGMIISGVFLWSFFFKDYVKEWWKLQRRDSKKMLRGIFLKIQGTLPTK